ncbi:hypothetical protein AVEN_115775-1 [Araneus ventricosus]|uniref:Glucose-methanol-choline oxidoreductase C-terminal domain-containing protein n=1 Tax=Araneus ventricosus TaxID=182803 RepID=A0A4Y1ZUV7_ARAVE|nr:hypothetical protein AVEN_115775-1 [Araneus ventricosus]
MQKVGAKPFETVFPGCEQFYGDEDSYFTCIIRAAVVTVSHPVGTAKMGDPRDPTTVVDPLLRFYVQINSYQCLTFNYSGKFLGLDSYTHAATAYSCIRSQPSCSCVVEESSPIKARTLSVVFLF